MSFVLPFAPMMDALGVSALVMLASVGVAVVAVVLFHRGKR